MANNNIRNVGPVTVPGSDLINPLSSALLFSGSNGEEDAELRGLILADLKEKLLEGKRLKEKRERSAKSAVESAKEAMEQKRREQNRCSHIKLDGKSSRLAGQILSGTGQLFLTCQYCHAEFYHPALPGQKEPPQHLVPPAEQIGG